MPPPTESTHPRRPTNTPETHRHIFPSGEATNNRIAVQPKDGVLRHHEGRFYHYSSNHGSETHRADYGSAHPSTHDSGNSTTTMTRRRDPTLVYSPESNGAFPEQSPSPWSQHHYSPPRHHQVIQTPHSQSSVVMWQPHSQPRPPYSSPSVGPYWSGIQNPPSRASSPTPSSDSGRSSPPIIPRYVRNASGWMFGRETWDTDPYSNARHWHAQYQTPMVGSNQYHYPVQGGAPMVPPAIPMAPAPYPIWYGVDRQAYDPTLSWYGVRRQVYDPTTGYLHESHATVVNTIRFV
ncbi:hypothetical protein CVT25_004096 [Psilocybe cyanescens]|uniref:Uncharacterized protein n=1 Tax=Psilocybe cyanescens TaxID=93625 RepID=A0A409X919_PSICY|nr:hypothetical protein CVT25_004096 [Psilocybe cyanescens]